MKTLTNNAHLDSFMQAVIVTDAQRLGARISNEQSQMDMREGNQRSECCNAAVIPEGLHKHCSYCGNYCTTH